MTEVRATLAFRPAEPGDVARVTALVNSAYRGDSSRAGWTTEADLLDGARTSEEEVRALIGRDDVLVLLCVEEGTLRGSVVLRRESATTAHLGMLVVEPALQARGMGKQIIAAAEAAVRARWGSATMAMQVLSVRAELIAFYERRGYRRTGETEPFPAAALSTPRVPDLRFERLEKALDA